MAKASIKFYPSVDRKGKKDGKIPFYLRVSSNGKKAECRLPIEISENELSFWSEITQRCMLKESNINRFLNKYEKEFEDMKYNLGFQIGTMTPNEIIDKITGRAIKDKETVLEYFQRDVYEKMTLKDVEKSSGTKKNYTKAFNHLKKHLVNEKVSTLHFADIKPDFAQSFLDYLTSEITLNSGEVIKKPMTKVSARGYIKKIKTYFTFAVRSGKLTRNPFDGFTVKGQSPYKEKLTTHQVKKLFTENWNLSPKMERVVDLFQLIVLTGIDIGDLQALTKNNLQYFSDTDVLLTGARAKTSIPYKQFLVSHASDILKKYNLDPIVQSSPFLLPRVSTGDCNKLLKIIAFKIDVPFNLTTKSGRHAFRNLLNEANVVKSDVIKIMMGHTSRRDIDGVYNEVRENKLLEARNLLEIFLKNLLINKEQ